jgi:hypothetical protein
MEAIANGPLSQLFALMLIPIVAVVLLGGLMIYAVFRRRKKSVMKHGPHVVSPVAEEASNSTLVSSNPTFDNQIVSSNDGDDLELGVLSKESEVESAMDEKQEPVNHNPVDLNARLESATGSDTQPEPSSEPVELLRLLRDPTSDQLLVEVAGQRYAKLSDVTDKDIGQYILQVAAHLLAFTNGRIVTDAGMKSVYQPKVRQAPMPLTGAQATSDSPADKISELPPATAAETPGDASDPEPKQGIEADLIASLGTLPQEPNPVPQKIGLFRRAPKPAPTQAAIPTINLAGEINDIVQARLRYSPLAEDHRVEITGDYSGGIRIRVNNEFYDSPDDIRDPQVRELIQAAIKEWERT